MIFWRGFYHLALEEIQVKLGANKKNSGLVLKITGWWFQICLIFIPNMEKIPILTSIFFRWVETSN